MTENIQSEKRVTENIKSVAGVDLNICKIRGFFDNGKMWDSLKIF